MDIGIIPYEYYRKNIIEFNYFKKDNNNNKFLNSIKPLNEYQRKEIRNYYLKILHQLEEEKYKPKSMFISSSDNLQIAKSFSKDEIIITFWSLNISEFSFSKLNIPIFKGNSYSYESETSMYGVIFPQYIYSFSYKNKVYYNPSINSEKNLELAVFSGLDIKQDNIKTKIKTETNLKKGLENHGNKDTEI